MKLKKIAWLILIITIITYIIGGIIISTDGVIALIVFIFSPILFLGSILVGFYLIYLVLR